MRLHNFHSSSASYRVRIALALKEIDYEYVPVALAWKDGEHDTPKYKRFNPQGHVPVLVDGETKIMQSMAILEYLEEQHPSPPLLPSDAAGRARVRSIALHVACEVQPLCNLRTERFLANELGRDADELRKWRRHWMSTVFAAVETELATSAGTGRFCHGDTPTIADCLLIPQVYNAQRPVAGLDLAPFPTIARINDACLGHPAFQRAHPTQQIDFQPLDRH